MPVTSADRTDPWLLGHSEDLRGMCYDFFIAKNILCQRNQVKATVFDIIITLFETLLQNFVPSFIIE